MVTQLLSEKMNDVAHRYISYYFLSHTHTVTHNTYTVTHTHTTDAHTYHTIAISRTPTRTISRSVSSTVGKRVRFPDDISLLS